MFNGQVQFVGAEPVVLPTRQNIVGVAIASVLGTHQKIEACMDVTLQKKASKGWNIYGRSELRSRIQMIGSVVKECNGMLDEVSGNEDLEAQFERANDAKDKFAMLGSTAPVESIKVPTDQLRTFLKSHTGKFVEFKTTE